MSARVLNLFWSYFFIFPSMVFLIVFMIYPLLNTFYLSLYDQTLFTSKFIGLDHYFNMLQDTLMKKSFLNTFYFVLLIVPTAWVISLTFAAALQGLHKHAKNLFRLIFYLPVVSTPVVLTLVWSWMYNPRYGIIEYLSGFLGFESFNVFSTQFSSMIALSVIVITWMVGQPIILYLASIDGISKELYEAAEIDGANSIQTFFRITIPMVSHTTLLIIITSTISVFQIFVVIYLMTSGGPNHGTETLLFTIYRTAFVNLEFGKASAQSVVLFFVISVIALVQFRLLKPKL